MSIIRDSYKGNHQIEKMLKPDSTFVTSMDIAIEDYLTSNLKNKFPNDNFLTEEKYNDRYLENRTWIIDPIDGTNHFIKSTNFYATQIAFYDKGTTMFSVIYIPTTDELYYAINNGGAYLNNNKILPKENAPIKETMIEFCGSIFKYTDEKFEYIKKFFNKDDNIQSILDIIYINSSSIAFTNLATEKVDGLITSVTSPWDILPGDLLCKEIGCKIYDLDFNSHLKLYTSNEEVKNLLLNIDKNKD